MGYTHYWQKNSTSPEGWASFINDARRLVAACPVPIIGELDEEEIALNGSGDDAYEDFVIISGRDGFAFCKTNRYPYDLIVAAVLAVGADLDDIDGRPILESVRSDGDPDEEEWVEALKFASETLGREIKYPCKE